MLFFNFNAVSVVTVTQGKAYVPLSLRTSVRLGMGGFCTRRGGCNTINPLVSTENQCRHFLVSWLTIPDCTGFSSRIVFGGRLKTRKRGKKLSKKQRTFNKSNSTQVWLAGKYCRGIEERAHHPCLRWISFFFLLFHCMRSNWVFIPVLNKKKYIYTILKSPN